MNPAPSDPQPLGRSDPIATPASARGDALLLGVALAGALSPVALDLARHWATTPWSRYSLVFPALFAVAALREERPIARSPGVAWIAAALALEVVAAFNGAIRWARPSLALAAFGLCRRYGLASPRPAVLLFFAVPAPAFAIHAGSEALESAVSDLVAAFAPSGYPSRPHRGAIALAPLLAGLAWYDAVSRRRALAPALAICAGAALLALTIHALARLGAVGAVAAGWPEVARALHGPGLWLPIAAAAIAASEWLRPVRAPGAGAA